VLAQHKVSEMIAHELTKGEVREEFVMDLIQKGFSNEINLKRGFLQVGNVQSNQMDILLLKQNAHVANIANQTVADPEDCLMVLEVKGNATGTDLKEYNDKIAKVKALHANSFPLFGIFCYRIQLIERNILKRFGFSQDRLTGAYFDEHNPNKNIQGLTVEYPNIDFFISVEIDENGASKQFYLRKNDVTGRYIKSVEYPVLKNIFSLTRSLLRTQ
jgi:hypothetical protein